MKNLKPFVTTHIRLFEELDGGDGYEEISYDQYMDGTRGQHLFGLNTISRIENLLESSGFKAYKSIEHASTPKGGKVRMVRNLAGEICMTFLPKKKRLLGKWSTSWGGRERYRGIEYESWNYDRKKIDTIEIKSIHSLRIKTDDDYWFYVQIYVGLSDPFRYFKCDDWKGLVSLLQKENFIT
jgi:hypothetical protein